MLQRLVWPALLTCLLCSGCGTGGRPVYPVRGQVLYEGKPTPGALVIFHPVEDPDPLAPRPIARVGPDGRFAPTTYRTGDGAPAGEYAVSISWVPEYDQQDPRAEREPANLLPERYSKAATSGLRVQIRQGPNELAPFRLSAKR
jgi:hypothetical protein